MKATATTAGWSSTNENTVPVGDTRLIRPPGAVEERPTRNTELLSLSELMTGGRAGSGPLGVGRPGRGGGGGGSDGVAGSVVNVFGSTPTSFSARAFGDHQVVVGGAGRQARHGGPTTSTRACPGRAAAKRRGR